jgi:ABC-2 type transport system ATP-binding protein
VINLSSYETPMIKLINLTKKYGKLTAVNKINLDVARGEIFGFLGPNGAGKTTTIKMMAGLLQPTDGSILIGGYDVQREPLKAKFLTGFIPDRPFLYEKLTATEFMHFVAELYEMKDSSKRVIELLDLFGLPEWADELIENFSHGMKQRLVMAAALRPGPARRATRKGHLQGPRCKGRHRVHVHSHARDRGADVHARSHHQ